MAIETVHSITPALAVLVSMVASVLILAFGKYPPEIYYIEQA